MATEKQLLDEIDQIERNVLVMKDKCEKAELRADASDADYLEVSSQLAASKEREAVLEAKLIACEKANDVAQEVINRIIGERSVLEGRLRQVEEWHSWANDYIYPDYHSDVCHALSKILSGSRKPLAVEKTWPYVHGFGEGEELVVTVKVPMTIMDKPVTVVVLEGGES